MFDEETIYVVTKYRIKYKEESVDARRAAIHAAVVASMDGKSEITGIYSIEQGFSFWDAFYVPKHSTT
jgi:hypothetical protein